MEFRLFVSSSTLYLLEWAIIGKFDTSLKTHLNLKHFISAVCFVLSTVKQFSLLIIPRHPDQIQKSIIDFPKIAKTCSCAANLHLHFGCFRSLLCKFRQCSVSPVRGESQFLFLGQFHSRQSQNFQEKPSELQLFSETFLCRNLVYLQLICSSKKPTNAKKHNAQNSGFNFRRKTTTREILFYVSSPPLPQRSQNKKSNLSK